MRGILRSASIYVASAEKAAIVAARHYNLDGIIYEQENPIEIANWRDAPALALALRAALARFSARDRNLRNCKITEWPSYRASRCASVREFERTFFVIQVQASNEAELFYEAEGRPHGESDIALRVSLNRYGSDDELNRQLVKLFDACVSWRVPKLPT